MKKKYVLVPVVLIAAGAATYRLVNQPPSSDLPANEQMYQLLADAGCMDCHVAEPKLPFYASFPLAGDLVKEDARLGYRAFDIAPMMEAIKAGTPVSEVDLAKVEKVIQDGTMPMAKYYLVHWGSSILDSEKTIALNWIRDQRAANYPNPLAAAEFANEPVRPIADGCSQGDSGRDALSRYPFVGGQHRILCHLPRFEHRWCGQQTVLRGYSGTEGWCQRADRIQCSL